VTWVFWPLLGVMTLVRAIAKHGAGKVAAGVAPAMPGMRACRGWTHGLAPQGILGLVVTLSFFHVWEDELARTALAAVAAASLVNELVAPWLLLRLLRGIMPASLASTFSGPGGRD
jgi:hypothetical protein